MSDGQGPGTNAPVRTVSKPAQIRPHQPDRARPCAVELARRSQSLQRSIIRQIRKTLETLRRGG
jgi:hypothetical protein